MSDIKTIESKGDIDLSVGSLVALVGVVAASILKILPLPHSILLPLAMMLVVFIFGYLLLTQTKYCNYC